MQSTSKCSIHCSSERKAIQEGELAGKPGQLVDKNERADEEQQRAAENFDGMQILAEFLVETHELADAQGSKQERHGEPRGVNGQEQDAARDSGVGGGEGQHGGE